MDSADLDIDWRWVEEVTLPPPTHTEKAIVYVKFDPRYAEVRLEETEL